MKPQSIQEIKSIALCFALLFCLSACNWQNKPEPGTLRMNLSSEPPTLDWNLANDSQSFDIISNIMTGLTRFGIDQNGNTIVVPGCALSWHISTDSSEYIFKLDPRAKWTDGRQVMAQDFIDSFTRLLDPDTAAPYADLLSIIDLKQSKAQDPETLYIKLKQPAAYFIYLTAYGLTLPIRKDLITKYSLGWTEPENLVTNGPFKLSKWQHEYKIILERNAEFHLYKPKTNLVQKLKYYMVPEQASAYTLYKNNQLDWVDNRSIPLSQVRKIDFDDPNNQQVKLLRNTYIGFNNDKTPFSNVLVRQAFAYAVDREALVKVLGKGDVANSTWIPPSLGRYLDYNQLVESFNKLNQTKANKQELLRGYFPELARAKLKQAGFPEGKGFPEVEFLIPNRGSSKLLAETLQKMWSEELNVEVKIQTMEWKVFLATLRDDTPDLYRLNWGADYPDPDTFASLFTKNNQINYAGFDDKNYDNLVKKAASSQNTELRQQLYTQSEILLTQEKVPITPLFIDTQNLLKKPYVKNLVLNPMDIVFLDQVVMLGLN